MISAKKINQAFVSVIEDYIPLAEEVRVSLEEDELIIVTESAVARKLREVSLVRAGGPNDLPNWVLKDFSDILAFPIADILNTLFRDCTVNDRLSAAALICIFPVKDAAFI